MTFALVLVMAFCAAVAAGQERDTTARIVNPATAPSAVADTTVLWPTRDTSEGAMYAFDKRDIYTTQYRSLPELLQRRTQQMPVFTGGFGQSDGVRLYGASLPQLSLLYSGRPMADPRTGSMPLELMSVEDIETVHIMVGSQSIGTSATPTMQAVRIQPAQFNHATPYVRWWYTQGSGDLLATDVTLSQNVAPTTNVTLGIRRAGGNGVFEGTEYDAWNMRASVRTAVSSATQVHVTYQGALFNSSLWGGVQDDAGSSLAPSLAVPVHTNVRDEHRRHDVAATATHTFDGSWQATATAWGQVHDLLRLRPAAFAAADEDSTVGNVYRSTGAGGVVRLAGKLGAIGLDAGASVMHERSDAGPWFGGRDGVVQALYGRTMMALTGQIELAVSARLDVIAGQAASGFGGLLTYRLDSSSTIRVDVSNGIERVPATMRSVLDMFRTTLVVVDAQKRHAWGSVRLQAWHRITTDGPLTGIERIDGGLGSASTPFRLVTSGVGEATSTGGIASTVFTIAGLRWEPVVRVESRLEQGRRSTDLQGELRAMYRYYAGKNWVDIGLRGIVFAPSTLDRWVAPSWGFVRENTERGWVTNGLDAELVASVGNASVRLSYENILAQPFTTVAMAPAFGGNFRLSLTWAFFD